MATDVNRNTVFCKRFAELRGERTQAEFAKFLGIARATVGFYENGERVPDAIVLKKICEACKVPSDYLLGLSEYKNQIDYDRLLQKVEELDGLDPHHKSYLLYSLGFLSERIQTVDNAELRENIIDWLADLLHNYTAMIYLPKLNKKTKKGVPAIESAVITHNATYQAHRNAIEALNKLGNAIEKEFWNQNFKQAPKDGEPHAT